MDEQWCCSSGRILLLSYDEGATVILGPDLERIRRFVRSRANLVGVAVGGAMGMLGVLGLAGPLWPMLAAGCYAIGAFMTPREHRSQGELDRAQDMREIVASFKRVQAQASRHTDASIVARVDRIRRLVAALAADVETQPQIAGNWETICQVSLEYVPATFENYLKIPKAYRRTVRGPGGKTARHELIVQLGLLEKSISEIAGEVGASRLEDMFEYRQFLEARFRHPLTW